MLIIAAAGEQPSVDDLSQQLANPLAGLISLPLQNNFEFKADSAKDVFAYRLHIPPVIPFRLTDDWKIISRTIIRIAYRDYSPGGGVLGLGDINARLFLSPKNAGPGGLIWCAGPVFLLPTVTDDYLGGGKFGLGPTALALVQKKAWTVGALGNHIWSVAGPSGRQDVSASLLQPFVSYIFGRGRSMSLRVDSTYDQKANKWTGPINLGTTQVFKLNDQAMSFQFGGRYYADGPTGTPEGGLRATVTFMFLNKFANESAI
ncbi:hypothetical protein CEV31_3689 [Brucella thiophenivorans]|uniref:Transporter n=1 Tax=Brucella thiophenivorans TaxID=571255 RepID=A0A256F9Z2_9HYPH|nr:hypothetical protein CEV31_3689 [Brucella thiophenivorans]